MKYLVLLLLSSCTINNYYSKTHCDDKMCYTMTDESDDNFSAVPFTDAPSLTLECSGNKCLFAPVDKINVLTDKVK